MQVLDPENLTELESEVQKRMDILRSSSVCTVVGFDIYKYSDFPLVAQTLIPVLMKNVIGRAKEVYSWFQPIPLSTVPD